MLTLLLRYFVRGFEALGQLNGQARSTHNVSAFKATRRLKVWVSSLSSAELVEEVGGSSGKLRGASADEPVALRLPSAEESKCFAGFFCLRGTQFAKRREYWRRVRRFPRRGRVVTVTIVKLIKLTGVLCDDINVGLGWEGTISLVNSQVWPGGDCGCKCCCCPG